MYGDTWRLNAPDNGVHHPHVPFSELVRPAGFVADGIVVAFSELWRAGAKGAGYCRRRWQVYRTEAALAQLDDRTLNDIGVERCHIPAIARTAVDNPGVDPRRAAS